MIRCARIHSPNCTLSPSAGLLSLPPLDSVQEPVPRLGAGHVASSSSRSARCDASSIPQRIHLSGKRYGADAMQEAAARADQLLDEAEAVH